MEVQKRIRCVLQFLDVMTNVLLHFLLYSLSWHGLPLCCNEFVLLLWILFVWSGKQTYWNEQLNTKRIVTTVPVPEAHPDNKMQYGLALNVRQLHGVLMNGSDRFIAFNGCGIISPINWNQADRIHKKRQNASVMFTFHAFCIQAYYASVISSENLTAL